MPEGSKRVRAHRRPAAPWAGGLPARLVRCIAASLMFAALSGSAQHSREYDLKAVFLYNFASFVEWPHSAYLRPESPFVIATLGSDPFGRALNDVVAGERVQGHPIVVRRYHSIQQVRAQPPHILFIGASESERVAAILNDLKGLPILTVSDLPGFLEAGGAISFTTRNRVQLRINPEAAHRAGLNISSKLLRLAQNPTGGANP